MLLDQDLKKLKKLLKEEYEWPSEYLFKFIVPSKKINKIEELFPNSQIEKKISKSGKYVGLTINIKLDSADVVIAIYQKASEIKGLISL